MDDSDDDPEIRNEMSPESDESVLVSVLACREEKSGLREAFNDTTPIVIFSSPPSTTISSLLKKGIKPLTTLITELQYKAFLHSQVIMAT